MGLEWAVKLGWTKLKTAGLAGVGFIVVCPLRPVTLSQHARWWSWLLLASRMAAHRRAPRASWLEGGPQVHRAWFRGFLRHLTNRIHACQCLRGGAFSQQLEGSSEDWERIASRVIRGGERLVSEKVDCKNRSNDPLRGRMKTIKPPSATLLVGYRRILTPKKAMAVGEAVNFHSQRP